MLPWIDSVLTTEKKRIKSSAIECLDDFGDFLSDDYNVEDELVKKELVIALNEFVRTLPEIQQSIFIKRYYYFQSIQEIADENRTTTWKVKRNIGEIKRNLREYLSKKELICFE